MSNQPRPFKRVRKAFDKATLKAVCEMHENEFGFTYGMEMREVEQRVPNDFYFFKDNGSDILAVAHLDTVMPHKRRGASFVDTEDGPVVFSGALDDRLGAYTILELLPKLGIEHDILLTVGEEQGMSTASFFDPTQHHEREYNWMIEFDRGGTDVVMYQYEDFECEALVKASGARFGDGSFSDIAFLEHLEIKGFNWGVGYRDYHGPRSHAYLHDYWGMIAHYLKFFEANGETYLPHEPHHLGRRGQSLWWEGDGEWCNFHFRYRNTKGICVDCDPDEGAEAEVVEADVVSEDFNIVQSRLLP